MPRRPRPNRMTPIVQRTTLTIPCAGGARRIRIGSTSWRQWLATATHFYVKHPLGSFACRKQQGQRGNAYWIAYRRSSGVVYRTYVGGTAALDVSQLDAAAQTLAQKAETAPSKL